MKLANMATKEMSKRSGCFQWKLWELPLFLLHYKSLPPQFNKKNKPFPPKDSPSKITPYLDISFISS